MNWCGHFLTEAIFVGKLAITLIKAKYFRLTFFIIRFLKSTDSNFVTASFGFSVTDFMLQIVLADAMKLFYGSAKQMIIFSILTTFVCLLNIQANDILKDQRKVKYQAIH